MKTYKGLITKRSDIPENGIYVFGSNTEGRHGKGSAQVARIYFGAIKGVAEGPQGRSYAIITKNLRANNHPSVSRNRIGYSILSLYKYALQHPNNDFYVAYTAMGTNLNGYSPKDMAEMFSSHPIPENMVFEEEFAKLLKAS